MDDVRELPPQQDDEESEPVLATASRSIVGVQSHDREERDEREDAVGGVIHRMKHHDRWDQQEREARPSAPCTGQQDPHKSHVVRDPDHENHSEG